VSEERIRADVDELCDFAGRLAGTDAERRACNHVAEKLRASGRSATVEPTYVQPQWAFVHLLTCALAVVGSTIADAQPLAGFIVVLVAATSAYLDLSARHYLIRRLPFRRASQNVHTLPAEIDGPTLIICANADAPRTASSTPAPAPRSPTGSAAGSPSSPPEPGSGSGRSRCCCPRSGRASPDSSPTGSGPCSCRRR